MLVGDEVVFASGAVDADGRLIGVDDPLRVPHTTTIDEAGDVVVYEMVAADANGEPTTYLSKMAGRLKDTRLLPRGWDANGPHVADTAPVGVDGDADFVGGGDRVQCRVPLPATVGADDACDVRVTLLYQSVPPAWVDALRTVEAEEAKRFVTWYDDARKVPEFVAEARRMERPGGR